MMKKLCLILVLFCSLSSSVLAENFQSGNCVSRVSTEKKWIALTFDAHDATKQPQYGVKEILDVLQANHLRCTFFVTGKYLELEPEIVTRIIKEGHEIGNHTYSHTYVSFDTLTRHQWMSELQLTREIFARSYHQTMSNYWRAPYGRYNREMVQWTEQAGLTQIGWTLDMLDWVTDPHDSLYLDANGLLQRFCDSLHGDARGYIYLCHLNPKRTRENLATVLQRMIDAAQAHGYRFVTISQLLT